MSQDRILYVNKDFAVVTKLVGEVCESQNGKREKEYPGSKVEKKENLALEEKLKSGKNQGNKAPLSLNDVLKPFIEERLGYGLDFCQCVNRLDTPVSGICVLALSPRAFALLSAVFREKNTEKIYVAVTEKLTQSEKTGMKGETASSKLTSVETSPVSPWGHLSENSSPRKSLGEWCLLENYMTFDTKRQKARITKEKSAKSKYAALEYRLLGEGDRYDFFEIKLKTGRTHQIRCQLSHLGHCIRGDVKYGARRSQREGGIRLHNIKLSFTNPYDGTPLCFYWPPAMDSLWKAALTELFTVSCKEDSRCPGGSSCGSSGGNCYSYSGGHPDGVAGENSLRDFLSRLLFEENIMPTITESRE